MQNRLLKYLYFLINSIVLLRISNSSVFRFLEALTRSFSLKNKNKREREEKIILFWRLEFKFQLDRIDFL